MQDRERRKDSVILRGLLNLETNEGKVKFKELCQLLINREVNLTDVVCINGDKGLFRAKIENAQVRRALLQEAHKLKQSQSFASVYLHRDLTYSQRQELRSRRSAQGPAQADTRDRGDATGEPNPPLG